MRSLLILFFCLLVLNDLFCQKGAGLSIFAGPNIANVVKRFNNTPASANATANPRNFNTINFIVGASLEKENLFQEFNLEAGLLYERIRSASNKFNDSYKPVIDFNIHYLGGKVVLSKPPLSGSQIEFGVGGFFYYAINKRFGRRDLFVHKRPLWGSVISIGFPISESLTFDTSFSIGLHSITKDIFTMTVPFTLSENVYSFQFIFLYKLFDIHK